MPRVALVAIALAAAIPGAACLSPEPEGLGPSRPAQTVVKFDFDHRPLPDIPLPNDLATRFDPDSPTGIRLNASMVAPTDLEESLRRQVDALDGWGVFQHITIPFSGPLDVQSILDGHRDPDYDTSNDVIYLIDVDPESPELGRIHHLDLGEGNYPVVLEKRDYWKNDPRGWLSSLLFEEADEDRDGDGVLDPGGDANGDGVIEGDEWPEDTDGDGVLDVPNYLPGASPERDDLAGRADALMTFYERETNTLIARPLVPLRERTTYAVVVTRRLLDADGEPVGSPFPTINHTAQTVALRKLPGLLPDGLTMDDVAFAYSFTTQSIESHWKPVRDGLYGHGVQAHLGEQFPPELSELALLRDPDATTDDGDRPWQDVTNPYLLYMENIEPFLPALGGELLGLDPSSRQWQRLETGLQNVDFMAMGAFESPQLFFRETEDGEPIPVAEQTWPTDLDTIPAPVRSETVHWTLYMPRKEVSARGEGGVVPVMMHGHGYTSNRLEALTWAGFFARHGIATLAIECPSHGIPPLSDSEMALATAVLGPTGLLGFLERALVDRAIDQNGDGEADSGADFWTSYLFHTRDMVRQCTLDHMQLTRILRTFDGQRTWAWDTDGDGATDLAGDFDGDGAVDIGEGSVLGMTGSSLGGIMSAMLASLEPEMSAAAPICGGGGLTDVGNRSLQGGVREAVQLRLMSPLYVGTLDAETGSLALETIVPDLNDDATLPLATVGDVRPGDTVVGRNMRNGEIRCGTVSPEGTFRFGVPSDLEDPTVLDFYRGPVFTGHGECDLIDGSQPYASIETFESDLTFQGREYPAGSPLVALAEGLALRRGSPEFRRLLTLAQLAVDPADPGVLVRHMSAEPLTYPGTGQTTGTHTLIITTMGDMNVPASAGVIAGRAAGFIPYLEDDPRYGKPANQVLLDTYTVEAVHTLGRYTDANGAPVHIDVEDFADGDDVWTAQGIPRLDPPLRLVGEDALCQHTPENCGQSGSLFPYPIPEGKHDLPLPGDQWDKAIAQCHDACEAEGGADCNAQCKGVTTFDIGLFFYNLVARYVNSRGTIVDFDRCNGTGDCADFPVVPPRRDPDTLP